MVFGSRNRTTACAIEPPKLSLRIWAGFESTPQLDWISESVRYEMWRQTHRLLVRKDSQYALHNDRFHIQVVATWVFALLMFFAFTNSISVLESWIMAGGGGCALGWFVFRAEQQRRNRAIGEELDRQLG